MRCVGVVPAALNAQVYAIWAPRDESTGPLPGGNIAFFCERAACSLFSFATFGVHMTGPSACNLLSLTAPGYTLDDATGEMSIWVARRSKTKQTWPNMLDQTVAGGIAAKASPLESVVREAMEEASLDADFVLERIRAGGVVSYTTRTRPVGWWQPCACSLAAGLTRAARRNTSTTCASPPPPSACARSRSC